MTRRPQCLRRAPTRRSRRCCSRRSFGSRRSGAARGARRAARPVARRTARALPPGAPFKRVPLHITDERLLGGLDLATTLRTGRRAAAGPAGRGGRRRRGPGHGRARHDRHGRSSHRCPGQRQRDPRAGRAAARIPLRSPWSPSTRASSPTSVHRRYCSSASRSTSTSPGWIRALRSPCRPMRRPMRRPLRRRASGCPPSRCPRTC